MTTSHALYANGHKLVAKSLNPEADGAPIILLHGITASINFWGADQFPIFCQQGPTYCLSLPGHYPATFPTNITPADITPQMIATTLARAIQQLVGSRSVTLVGHSTGGFAALSIAAYHPEVVSQVISISGFAQGRWTGTLGLGQKLARGGRLGHFLFRLAGTLPKLTRASFRMGWRAHVANRQSLSTYPHLEQIIDQFYPDYQQLDANAMLKYFRAMPDIDISHRISRIQAPTLALTGDEDPTVPPSQAQLIADRVPNAALSIIQGGGHFLFMENPDEYRRILRGWLQRERV